MWRIEGVNMCAGYEGVVQLNLYFPGCVLQRFLDPTLRWGGARQGG